MSRSPSGPCNFCKAIVLWPTHKTTGRTNPLDPQPAPNGTALLDRQRMVYEFLTGDDLERARAQGIPLFIAHAATCSNPPLR